MPSIYFQFIAEVQARVTALGGWGSGGVRRSHDFAVERQQRPAARIGPGVVRYNYGANVCEWSQDFAVTISITSNTDTELDGYFVALCAALEAPWTTPGVMRVRPVEVLFREATADATAYQLLITLAPQSVPLKAYHVDQRK